MTLKPGDVLKAQNHSFVLKSPMKQQGNSGQTWIAQIYGDENTSAEYVIKIADFNAKPGRRNVQNSHIAREIDVLDSVSRFAPPVIRKIDYGNHKHYLGTEYSFLVIEIVPSTFTRLLDFVEEKFATFDFEDVVFPVLELLVLFKNFVVLLDKIHKYPLAGNNSGIIYNDVDTKHIFWNREYPERIMDTSYEAFKYRMKIIDWANALPIKDPADQAIDIYQVGELIRDVFTNFQRIETNRLVEHPHYAKFYGIIRDLLEQRVTTCRECINELDQLYAHYNRLFKHELNKLEKQVDPVIILDNYRSLRAKYHAFSPDLYDFIRSTLQKSLKVELGNLIGEVEISHTVSDKQLDTVRTFLNSLEDLSPQITHTVVNIGDFILSTRDYITQDGNKFIENSTRRQLLALWKSLQENMELNTEALSTKQVTEILFEFDRDKTSYERIASWQSSAEIFTIYHAIFDLPDASNLVDLEIFRELQTNSNLKSSDLEKLDTQITAVLNGMMGSKTQDFSFIPFSRIYENFRQKTKIPENSHIDVLIEQLRRVEDELDIEYIPIFALHARLVEEYVGYHSIRSTAERNLIHKLTTGSIYLDEWIIELQRLKETAWELTSEGQIDLSNKVKEIITSIDEFAELLLIPNINAAVLKSKRLRELLEDLSPAASSWYSENISRILEYASQPRPTQLTEVWNTGLSSAHVDRFHDARIAYVNSLQNNLLINNKFKNLSLKKNLEDVFSLGDSSVSNQLKSIHSLITLFYETATSDLSRDDVNKIKEHCRAIPNKSKIVETAYELVASKEKDFEELANVELIIRKCSSITTYPQIQTRIDEIIDFQDKIRNKYPSLGTILIELRSLKHALDKLSSFKHTQLDNLRDYRFLTNFPIQQINIEIRAISAHIINLRDTASSLESEIDGILEDTKRRIPENSASEISTGITGDATPRAMSLSGLQQCTVYMEKLVERKDALYALASLDMEFIAEWHTTFRNFVSSGYTANWRDDDPLATFYQRYDFRKSNSSHARRSVFINRLMSFITSRRAILMILFVLLLSVFSYLALNPSMRAAITSLLNSNSPSLELPPQESIVEDNIEQTVTADSISNESIFATATALVTSRQLTQTSVMINTDALSAESDVSITLTYRHSLDQPSGVKPTETTSIINTPQNTQAVDRVYLRTDAPVVAYFDNPNESTQLGYLPTDTMFFSLGFPIFGISSEHKHILVGVPNEGRVWVRKNEVIYDEVYLTNSVDVVPPTATDEPPTATDEPPTATDEPENSSQTSDHLKKDELSVLRTLASALQPEFGSEYPFVIVPAGPLSIETYSNYFNSDTIISPTYLHGITLYHTDANVYTLRNVEGIADRDLPFVPLPINFDLINRQLYSTQYPEGTCEKAGINLVGSLNNVSNSDLAALGMNLITRPSNASTRFRSYWILLIRRQAAQYTTQVFGIDKNSRRHEVQDNSLLDLIQVANLPFGLLLTRRHRSDYRIDNLAQVLSNSNDIDFRFVTNDSGSIDIIADGTILYTIRDLTMSDVWQSTIVSAPSEQSTVSQINMSFICH